MPGRLLEPSERGDIRSATCMAAIVVVLSSAAGRGCPYRPSAFSRSNASRFTKNSFSSYLDSQSAARTAPPATGPKQALGGSFE